MVKDYPEFYYKHKNKKNFFHPYSQNSINKIKSYIKGKVLEVGTGDGNLSSLLIDPEKVISYTGIDLHNIFLNDVRLKMKDKDIKSINLIKGDFLEFDLIEKFDVVISFDVIEHTQNPIKFLEKIYNQLNNGGTAIVSTSNKFIYRISAKIADGNTDPTHINEMSYKKFEKIFSNFFKIIDNIYTFPVFPTIFNKTKNQNLWFYSEKLAKKLKFFSLNVVLIGKK